MNRKNQCRESRPSVVPFAALPAVQVSGLGHPPTRLLRCDRSVIFPSGVAFAVIAGCS